MTRHPSVSGSKQFQDFQAEVVGVNYLKNRSSTIHG